jgi:predicted  nucleic acid-binding Zn-ribbon protein
MKGLEAKLNTVMSKIEVIEKTSSLEGVKNEIESFNKTLEVMKKLFSDLKKNVEDQEVKTAVLEKKYLEAQTPLEPVKKAIEEVKKLVTGKLEAQDKRISSAEENIKSSVTSVETSMKNLGGRIQDISGLESRIKNLERPGSSVVVGTITAEVAAVPAVVQAPVGTETAKVAEAEKREVSEEKAVVPSPEAEGFQGIGEGFYVRNVNLSLFGSSSKISGEIKNLTDKDHSLAPFVVRVYNDANVLLFSQDFSVKTFKKGEVRTFGEIISGYKPLEISKYEIEPKRKY